MDGRTDRQMDGASYRDARTLLKKSGKIDWIRAEGRTVGRMDLLLLIWIKKIGGWGNWFIKKHKKINKLASFKNVKKGKEKNQDS